ncbi:MAG: RING finger protein [Planctomycetota bacterium]
MECFLALIIFLFIAVLASGVGSRGAHRGNRAYVALTERFGGTYQAGGVFRPPTVRFRHGQTWVAVHPGPRRADSRTTQVRLEWPDHETELRVGTALDSSVSAASGQDILVGDDEFDRHYHVNGYPESQVKRLLSDGVRWQLNRLRQGFECPGVGVFVHRGRMIVEKPMLFRRGEDLEEFTQFCLELFDQAMLTRCDGIQFMDSNQEAQLIESPICQICREEITTNMVFCRRCRTPHHLECWQYTGRCSVYGCRETRYLVPAVARTANESGANTISNE